ncbi:MAG TPA: endonuclease MutS2, partial [Chloroflexota bacterium]
MKAIQAATSEAVRLLASRPSLTIGAARDVRPMVDRATLGAILSSGDLVDILGTIDSARAIRELLHRGQLVYPELATYIGRLHPLKSLRDCIAETINEHGEVVDSASPQLTHLRREVRTGRDRIMRRLEAIIADPNNAEAIQEPIVTERNGRYVIAVKAAHRHAIRGVVHDQSESGATLFLEPLATVDMTNDWRQSQLDEQKEVERILRLLSNRVALEAAELNDVVAALAALDATFAKAHYAERLEAIEPDLNVDGVVDLVDARHPLLTGRVVPQTIRLGESFRVLIITGPNTGGKTVALKTVGLLTLMAQCGLRIPAASGSKVAVFEQVLADIGDEQSIEQSLSTFSGHLRNIVAMLGVAGPRSLVLLDELGAGTDPDEGSELARAILEHLLARGVSTIATTHYSELKTFAHDREGVENASVEFNVNTLTPTYRLRIGTPGRSNALAIASRLGLPSEIVASARGGLSEEHLEAESLLEDIHRKERTAARERNRATRDQQQQRRLRAEAANALSDAERIRQEARETAYTEADAELSDLRREAARLARELERARRDRGGPVRRRGRFSQPAALGSEELHTRLVEARRRGHREAARALQAQLADAVERERKGAGETEGEAE